MRSRTRDPGLRSFTPYGVAFIQHKSYAMLIKNARTFQIWTFTVFYPIFSGHFVPRNDRTFPDQRGPNHSGQRTMISPPPTVPTSSGKSFDDGAATKYLGKAPTRSSSPRYPYFRPPLQDDELGRLGEYRVLRHLATGGMGTVFVAEDVALRRPVALKVMNTELEQKTDDAWGRFLREARAMAQLRHENLVNVYQVGQEGGTAFLAMELLEGQTLGDWIAHTERANFDEVLRIATEITRGLEAIHRQNLIHRDIKPNNIWIEKGTERAKILDFGLVREIKGDPNLTEAGVIVGTPAYLSPEQARGRNATVRSDLFSLGCVLYEMCTRKLPFRGENTLDQLAALVADTPTPVHELNPTVPPAFSDLIMRLLAKNPEDRPASAKVVEELLDQLRFDQLKLPKAPKAEAHKHTRKTRWVAGASVTVLIIVGVVVALPWLTGPAEIHADAVADALLPAPEGATFLTELPKLDPIHWPFQTDADGRPKRTIGLFMKPVNYQGMARPRSLHMHPAPPFVEPASLSFRLDRKYEKFLGHVSLADETPRAPSMLTFSVFGDGALLWKSRAVFRPVDGQTFEISVRDVNLLKIQAQADGDINRLYAAWIDPFLIPKKPG